MPLIVAVERDREQIDQLTAVAVRVKAELQLADSIDSALRLIDAELPDVVLIPALLSSRDALALGSRLRDLGASAAHVQMLTIPRFEPSASLAAGRMLSFRRRKKASALVQTTAVDSFADQLTVYLDRATAIGRPPRRPTGGGWRSFDPSEPRFVALVARLDELTAYSRESP
jgi:hypothetical protein